MLVKEEEEGEPALIFQRKTPFLGGRTARSRCCLSSSATESSLTGYDNGRKGFWHKLAYSGWLAFMLLDSSQKIQSARHDYLFLQEIPAAWADWASSGLPLSWRFSFISHTSVWNFTLCTMIIWIMYISLLLAPRLEGLRTGIMLLFGHLCIPRALLRSGTWRLSKKLLVKRILSKMLNRPDLEI